MAVDFQAEKKSRLREIFFLKLPSYGQATALAAKNEVAALAAPELSTQNEVPVLVGA